MDGKSNAFLMSGRQIDQTDRKMELVESGGSGWFLDFGFADEARRGEYLWPLQVNLSDQHVDCSCKEAIVEKPSVRKRVHDELHTGRRSKACLEKLRRDRLNGRFEELCSMVDPRGALKSDKIAVLSDAAHTVNQLRAEAQMLIDANQALHHSIKCLKAEKVELRDAKMKLKEEKERIEQGMVAMSMPSPFIQVPVLAFHGAAFSFDSKATLIYHDHPFPTMWQWIPPATLDTSRDHVLRPPVA